MSPEEIKKRLLGSISMAQRAGRIASGAFAVDKAMSEHRVHLLLIAGDAADESMKKYKEAATKNHIPYAVVGDREWLGSALGKDLRSAAAVLDAGFAKSLRKITEGHMTE